MFSKMAIGCSLAVLLTVMFCAGVAVLVNDQPAEPQKTSAVPASAQKLNVAAAVESESPNTWERIIQKRRVDDATALEKLSLAQQGYAARRRIDATMPVFQNESPSTGDFGKLAPVEFLTIVSRDTAQFHHPPTGKVYMLKGISLENLTPGGSYSFDFPWEVIGSVEYKTVLGARHRAPVLKRLDIEPVRIAIENEQETASLSKKLRTWEPSTGKRVGIFQRLTIDDQNFGVTITIEECPGVPLEIPVELLSTNDLAAVRSLHGGPVRIASPEDRALLRAGHKHRPRQWSTADGKFTVDASFVSIAGTTISIRRVDDAAKVEIDQRKLGDDDQKYLQTKAWKNEAPLER
jgi:hypothetical protein